MKTRYQQRSLILYKNPHQQANQINVYINLEKYFPDRLKPWLWNEYLKIGRILL